MRLHPHPIPQAAALHWHFGPFNPRSVGDPSTHHGEMIHSIASHRPVHCAPECHPHTVNVFTANKQGRWKAVQNALNRFLFYYLNRSRGLERCLRDVFRGPEFSRKHLAPQLRAACNSNSRGSGILFWLPWPLHSHAPPLPHLLCVKGGGEFF